MKHLEIKFAQISAVLGFVAVCFISTVSHAASVSDLLITEVMANPAAVSDSNGEWIELFNPTNESIDLSGTVLSDSSSPGHSISTDSSLLVSSGDYFVLARNDDSNTNGGVTVDYVYSSFSLSNSSDQIIFSDTSGELLRLDYSSGFVPSGASMELIDAVMIPENYATSNSAFGAGDFGTPGIAGSFTHEVAPSPVPLPGAVWLMGSGLLGMAGFSRRHHS